MLLRLRGAVVGIIPAAAAAVLEADVDVAPTAVVERQSLSAMRVTISFSAAARAL
jgi:hypothetical protein